jgi:hypothetical protein
MRLAYDPATDSLYIHLSERTSVESTEVADGVVLNFDAEGHSSESMCNAPASAPTYERLIVSRLPFHEMEAA